MATGAEIGVVTGLTGTTSGTEAVETEANATGRVAAVVVTGVSPLLALHSPLSVFIGLDLREFFFHFGGNLATINLVSSGAGHFLPLAFDIEGLVSVEVAIWRLECNF